MMMKPKGALAQQNEMAGVDPMGDPSMGSPMAGGMGGGMDEGPEPDDLSPETQEVLKMVMQDLYEEGSAEELAETLQNSPNIAQGIKDITKSMLKATDEESQGAVPDEEYMLFGMILMGEVADIAEAAGIPVTGKDLSEAMRDFIGEVLSEMGGDMSQVKQAMGQIDPSQMGQELEQQA